MGTREDDDYWNNRWIDPPFCSLHEDEEMSFDVDEAEWWCRECENNRINEETYKYG